MHPPRRFSHEGGGGTVASLDGHTEPVYQKETPDEYDEHHACSRLLIILVRALRTYPWRPLAEIQRGRYNSECDQAGSRMSFRAAQETLDCAYHHLDESESGYRFYDMHDERDVSDDDDGDDFEQLPAQDVS